MVARHVRSTVWMITVVMLLVASAFMHADDWPQYRGRRADGVWNETGIIEKFPEQGLKVLWRAPIKRGLAGAAVAGGRVYVTDFEVTKPPTEVVERVLALDEKTGQVLWTREWEANYIGIVFPMYNGPRATPTVDGDRVYVLGAAGVLLALKVQTGELLWRKDYQKDLGAQPKKWSYYYGFGSPPIVDGDRLIAIVGGEPNAKVVAFDKLTGRELWRALSSETEPGVSQPIIITAGGTRQLIVWHVGRISSLDPTSGMIYWEQPVKVDANMAVVTPIFDGSRLLVSSFYNGAIMLTLDPEKPSASVLWRRGGNEILTDGLHSMVATPFLVGDYLYGICSFGQLRGLDARTGERLWETQAVTKERVRHTSAFLVRHGDRFFINNDRGELIIARLTPDGYHEISRTQLITPTMTPWHRRELDGVNLSHPAYVNRHLYARNDEEIIAVTLAAVDYQ